jgi:hypothetical protein
MFLGGGGVGGGVQHTGMVSHLNRASMRVSHISHGFLTFCFGFCN